MKRIAFIVFVLLGLLIHGFSQEIIIESRSEGKNFSWYSETSGSWADSVAKSLAEGCSPESIGSRFVIIDGGPAQAQARFTPVLPKEGKYDIYGTWGRSGNAFNVKFIINTGTEEVVKYQDQCGWGGALAPNAYIWSHLGTYDLPAGNKAYVAVDASEVKGKPSEENSGRVYADAIKIVPYDPSASPLDIEASQSPTIQTASTFSPYTQESSPFASSPATTSQVPSTSSSSPSLPFVPLSGTSPQNTTVSQPITQPATQSYSQPSTPFSQSAASPFNQPATQSQASTPFTQPSTQSYAQSSTPFSQSAPSPFTQPATQPQASTAFTQPSTQSFAQSSTPFSQSTSSPFTQPATQSYSQSSTPFSQTSGSLPPIQSGASLQWYTSYNEAIPAGIANNKSILLFFRSALGKSSNIMENDVLNNPQVRTKLLQYFICCKLDITQNRAVCDYYGIFKAPVLVFLDARGYSRARIDNLLDPDELARELEKYK